jgi:two-component system sensor histidine kinase RegB
MGADSAANCRTAEMPMNAPARTTDCPPALPLHTLLRTGQAIDDDVVARVGALAAGAAHELARPLSTMAVVLADLQDRDDPAERAADIAILRAQVEACRTTLRNLMVAGGVAPVDGGGRVAVDALLAEVARRCRETRPGVGLAVRLDGLRPAPQILAEQSLCQAILILLDNAADASPDDVDMRATWDAVSLKVAIADRGGGVRPEHRERLGRSVFTTKPAGQGTGVGLVLARNALARLGGVIRWSNRSAGGLCAELELPLGPLRVG